MERLYFDYNASAPLAKGLMQKLKLWVEEDYKNPNSAHSEGQKAKAVLESARKSISKHLNLRHHDKLIFNSGGTEGNNTVIHAAHLQNPQKKVFVLSRVEHSCVYNYAQFLATRGVELRYIDVSRDGEIDFVQYESLLDDNVFLVSVMLAQNETGFVFPVKELAKMAHAKGILFHSDVVCAMGKMPVDFQDLDIDFLTFSSHKFGALKGTGGLVVRGDVKWVPYIYGGTQELEKRAGTQNILGVASAAYALDQHLQDLTHDVPQFVQFREQLKKTIQELYPQCVILESKNHLPQTLSVAFVGHSGNLLLTNLDLEGVAVSYGSACASGSLEISRVMRELKLPLAESRSVLRISFGAGTTQVHIDQFAQRLQSVLQRMAV